MTQRDEEALEKWVLSMDSRGAAPRPNMVAEMANLLLAARGIAPVGVNWVSTYIQRTPSLRSRLSRRYDYQRAQQEDPRVLREWFRRVESAIAMYGILPEDIYNFDETGFAMGLCATAKVVTRAEYYGRRSVLQPGNREWVTVIETIGAEGYTLPPMIIFKGKLYKESWFQSDLPQDWRFEVSANGWTTDAIGLRWLEKLFIPYARTRGRYRLLVLDGHGSHLTPRFDQLCTENDIIPICMPAHSSHLLQPLDVGCFAGLKRAYGKLVDQKMRMGINHIDKLDFLAAYPIAPMDAFQSNTIQNSFKAAGLVPLNAESVLSKLNISLRTPTPMPSRPSSRSSEYQPHTPATIAQLAKHQRSAKSLLKYRSKSPPTPTKQVIEQMYKACDGAMRAILLLERENKDLREANRKQKKKRSLSNRLFASKEGLSVQESQGIRSGLGGISTAEDIAPALAPAPVPAPGTRRIYTCSICRMPGHGANRCPERDN